MGNTPVNVQHTGPEREEGERGGEEGERGREEVERGGRGGGEEIRGYRLISIGDKRLRKIFSPPSQKKNSLIKYLQQLSVVGYIGHLWPV